MIINKVENSKLNDKPRIIFDYFKIIKFLLNAHFELNFKIYNHFSNLKHNYLFLTNLKHIYFIISFHFNDHYYFVFTIFEIN